jgi:hypothetical protein
VSEADAAAIATARAGGELDDEVPARAWPVRRLDRPGDSYFLVLFGEDDATVAVATVSADGDSVQSMATLRGETGHFTVDAAAARALAGADADAPAALVWRPCRASRSPFYPLWEVAGQAGPVYVDHAGTVSEQLDDD